MLPEGVQEEARAELGRLTGLLVVAVVFCAGFAAIGVGVESGATTVAYLEIASVEGEGTTVTAWVPS